VTLADRAGHVAVADMTLRHDVATEGDDRSRVGANMSSKCHFMRTFWECVHLGDISFAAVRAREAHCDSAPSKALMAPPAARRTKPE
jgi:hypothetical protein